ncbi:hypothetical protein [Brevibacillus sp. SYSU BS000544]|uniref:hypothetical protein n=1 Tax=Brevibacillus sp. SYSU BS000544 TaxID=3416443 RepID=UPI003CE51589
MGHNITAVILKGNYDEKHAINYDLHGKQLGFHLTMFHIDHYYSAYWQKKMNATGYLPVLSKTPILFPSETVISVLMSKISGLDDPIYAIMTTEYFGGVGSQCAHVYKGLQLIDESTSDINAALKLLGVTADQGMDEFDTIALGKYRYQPDYLDKYVDLADELGV